jgi:hypothetical protein
METAVSSLELLVIVLGVVFFFVIIFNSCQSEPANLEESKLARSFPNSEEKCHKGHIVKMESLNYDYEVVLVKEPNSDGYWTALAQTQENFSVGDTVEACAYEMLESPHINGYGQIHIIRRDVNSRYELSELEKYKQCKEDLKDSQGELADCNAQVSTFIEALEKSKEVE